MDEIEKVPGGWTRPKGCRADHWFTPPSEGSVWWRSLCDDHRLVRPTFRVRRAPVTECKACSRKLARLVARTASTEAPHG